MHHRPFFFFLSLFKDDGCISGFIHPHIDFFSYHEWLKMLSGLICSLYNFKPLLCISVQMSVGLNVPSVYDCALHCVLNYLALIFPSLLGLINCVVCLPSITASWAVWSRCRVMAKPFEELVVNVNKTSPWVSRFVFVFYTNALYEEIYVLTLHIWNFH